MRFSVISTALVSALSVSAAALDKRDISAPIQTCMNDLNNVGSLYTTFTNGVNSYTASQGYAGFLTIQSQESSVESKLMTAKTDCCAVSGPISDDDVSGVSSVIDALTPIIVSAMDALINKKPVFDSAGSLITITPTIKSDINSLHAKTIAVTICLDPGNSGVQPYIDEIEEAFQRAIAAYA